ncbi:phage head spike fiber domain-containing protein [Aeromonas hydrophila]|uniref:phage head spike fiber domain-containing protein n=1 Tax=Aeromonas hydrophila TaxID=644 RepID=UPI0038D0783E
MAGLWYRAGTVSVTSGSKKVTGFGTKWKTSVSKPDKGHPIHAPDGRIYELDYVESDTVLWLVSSYAGTTAADQAYAIDITRTGTVPAFSRDLSAFVAYHQGQMDGWQQLLTGIGDVILIAPDGTKLTVPSWEKVMNAGNGVVAQAKAEADRAKLEAQSAAVSASSAGNAVVAAALPLPDVWAPLSDSLRLITGYGREVLVGSDVVARMVNFSRSTTATYIGKDGTLKTAAANDPRFEKDGLLIEGQSTNLWPSQTAIDSVNAPAGQTTLPDGTTGSSYKITPTAGAYAYVQKNFSAQSGSHTLSCFAKLDDGSMAMPSIYCGFNGGLSTKLSGTYLGNGWWRMQAVLAAPTGNIGFGYAPGGAETIPVWVCNFQLEALAFASSYIPTNGAAVTRAADRAWIQATGNIGRVATISVIAHPLNPANMPRAFVFGASGFGGVEASGANYLFTGIGQSSTYVAIGPEATARVFARRATAVTFGVGVRTAVTPMEPGGADWGDFIHIGGVLTGGAHKLPFWGHLRDFKVWMEPRNLTDAQFKAVA